MQNYSQHSRIQQEHPSNCIETPQKPHKTQYKPLSNASGRHSINHLEHPSNHPAMPKQPFRKHRCNTLETKSLKSPQNTLEMTQNPLALKYQYTSNPSENPRNLSKHPGNHPEHPSNPIATTTTQNTLKKI